MAYDLLLHNWVERPVVRTSWLTDVGQSTETLAEQRLGLLANKPKRSIEVNWTAWDRILGLRLLVMIQQATDQGPRVPFYPDQAVTTASSSGTTINCPTTYRRFSVGSMVVIHERDSEGRASNPQFGVVASKTSTTITLQSALTGSYPTGSVVYPVLQCHKILDVSGQAHTDGTFTVKATFEEELGPLSLDPTAAESSDEILVLNPDWTETVEIGVVRPGTKQPLGRSSEVQAQGLAPMLSFRFTVTEFGREDVFSVLQLFDSCRGRLVPLWLVSPLVVFEAVAVGANHVDVEIPPGATPADVDTYLNYLGLRLEDGTVEILTVSSVALVGSVWRITVVEAVAATLDEILSCSSAHQVRFADDELEESWATDEACQLVLSFVEVQNEDQFGHDLVFEDCSYVVD